MGNMRSVWGKCVAGECGGGGVIGEGEGVNDAYVRELRHLP